MKIAVVGAGGAGLVSAWLLQAEHDVVVFESADRAGGHARTMLVEDEGRNVPVELGAQFFFEEGYSVFCALLERLQLRPARERVAASMTLEDGRCIVVPPMRAAAIATCLSPRTIRDLRWLTKFIGAGEEVVRAVDWSVTIDRLFERAGIPREVADSFLVPLVASSWGLSRELAREMPAYNVMRVMNLKAMQIPHALRLDGGLSSYIDALIQDSPRAELRVDAKVEGLDREGGKLRIHSRGRTETFDAVILACDWRNSAALTNSIAPEHSRAFGAFDDYPVTIAVHRDASCMPANRSHWELMNYSLSREVAPRTTVWSGKPTKSNVFRSWMRASEPEPKGTLRYEKYRHVLVTPDHPARQRALAKLQGEGGIWAAGMYTEGIDNHESALRSAHSVAKRLSPEGERVKWFGAQISS